MNPAAPAAKTVLVVDEDEVIREGLGVVLGRAGLKMVPARDGREALAILRGDRPPGLVLLDMMLPVMDGWEFLQEVGRDAALAAVPVIIITAVGTLSREWATSHGAAAVFQKPIDVNNLLAEIRRLLQPDAYRTDHAS